MGRLMMVACFVAGLLASAPAHADGVDRDALFDHDLRELHSDRVLSLREVLQGAPLLLVNTASRCGFTGQFEGLEALHREFGDQGLKVAGFPSNDFRQELEDEAVVAEVCRVNFGVTFTMFSPISVRGDDAHPLFRELARQSEQPAWNFHKYVLDRDGNVVASFPSRVAPDDPRLRAAIRSVL
ncbi:glutathione peroxidase [Alkalispirillum mobile]|uniref:Glutathione peroxidase n=1 Tax=Alkalispirillum mobile TaxID=85925 RepID=A0A498CA03_9GAMM|nr:glutathione peroxidase [Alkalispirillum mobile]